MPLTTIFPSGLPVEKPKRCSPRRTTCFARGPRSASSRPPEFTWWHYLPGVRSKPEEAVIRFSGSLANPYVDVNHGHLSG